MTMDPDVLQHTLEDLQSRIAARRKVPAHLKQLKQQHKECIAEQRMLARLVDDEKADVNKLERFSVTSLFLQLMGRKRDRLELEHQEYVAAALKYNACLNMLETLQYEILLLTDKYAELSALEERYQDLLQTKERMLHKAFPAIAAKIMRYDDVIRKKRLVIVEIDEALKAGMHARTKVRSLLKELDKVAEWVRYQSGHAVMGRAGRKQFVDRVGKKAVDAGATLNTFEIELKDVFKSLHIRDIFDRRGLEGFLDVFHDNLMTDWIVKSNLSHTRNNLTGAMDKINGMLATLRKEKRTKTGEIRDIAKHREELILRHK